MLFAGVPDQVRVPSRSRRTFSLLLSLCGFHSKLWIPETGKMGIVVRRRSVRSSLRQTTAKEGSSKSRCVRGRQIDYAKVEKTGGQQGSPAPHVPRARTVAQGPSPHQARTGGGD